MGRLRIILNRRSAGVMLAVSSGALFLSACAVPPSVQIASWVADGVSYIVTQKSLTDHGLSLLAQRDCALWRGIKGEAICRGPDSGTFAVASNNDGESAAGTEADAEEVAVLAGFETAAGGAQQQGEKTPGMQRGEKTPDMQRGEKTPEMQRGEKTPGGIFNVAKNTAEPFAVPVRAAPWFTAMAPGLREQGRSPKATPTERTAQSGLFYVIGSFTRLDFAQALVQRQGTLNARLVDVSLRGSSLYRVVVGPFDQGRQYYVYRRIAEAGINGAWATLMTLPAARRTAQAPPNEGRPVKSPAPGLHYVIGSFSDPGNAFNLAKRLAALAPDVVTPRGGGGIYRVVVGPFDGKDIRQGRRGIQRAGVAGAWPVYLNPGEWSIAENRDAKAVRRLSEAPAFHGAG